MNLLSIKPSSKYINLYSYIHDNLNNINQINDSEIMIKDNKYYIKVYKFDNNQYYIKKT